LDQSISLSLIPDAPWPRSVTFAGSTKPGRWISAETDAPVLDGAWLSSNETPGITLTM
jgi:hypothetical protein